MRIYSENMEEIWMRVKSSTGHRRLISFLLIAVLLFGIAPTNVARASEPDTPIDVSESIVLEPEGTGDANEGVTPSGAEEPDGEEDLGSAEGNGPEGEAPPAGEQTPPAEGEEPPAGEQATPAEDEEPPIGEQTPPADGEEPPAGELPPATPTDLPDGYANSICGSLWLDTYEDIDSGIIGGDGIRQAEEEALSGYAVSLYPADDRANAIKTATTNGNGEYRFENIEPGSYVVGISDATIGGVEYLLPIAGITGDNQFSDFSANHTTIYSASIEVEEDTTVSGIDAGIRMPQSNAVYANSISGSLWLDVFDDPASGVHSGDGIRQPEEEALSGYAVSLYPADDRQNAVKIATTSGSGEYQFAGIEPGSYVVGISATIIDDVEYLLPIAGVTQDNRFAEFDEEYTTIYSTPIEVTEDTAVTEIDAGMRIPPKKQALGAVDGTVVGNWLYQANLFQYRIDAYNRTATQIQLTVFYQYATNWSDAYYQWSTDPTFSSGVSSWYGFPFSPMAGGTRKITYNVSSSETVYLRFRAVRMPGTVSETGFVTTSVNDQYFVFAPPLPPPPQITSYYVSQLWTFDARVQGTWAGGRPDSWGLYLKRAVDPNWNGPSNMVVTDHAWGGPGCFVAYTFSQEIGWTLEPNTLYDAHLYAYNAGGQDARALQFTTLPLAPTATTTAATNIGTTTAQLNGTYNLQGAAVSSGVFRYSTDPGLAGYTEVGFGPGYTSTNAWNAISGLSPNTTYYYQIYVTNGNAGGIGGSASGGIGSFTTLPPPPTVTTNAVSGLTTTSATLNATYDLHGQPMTSGVFRYGTNASLSAGYTDVPFDGGYNETNGWHTLSGLTPNTRYYYKAIVSTADGPGEGTIQSFVTLPDFSSWTATVKGPTTALISGFFAGSPGMITAATITYGTKSDLSDGTTIPLANPTGSSEGFGTVGLYYTLQGLTGLGTTPWYVKITLTNAGGSTTTEIRPIGTYHTVRVKYLDKDDHLLGERTDLIPVNIPYTLPLADIDNHQAVYYTVDGGSKQEINLASPPSLTITADTTIEVYYASTIMTISYPVNGMSFAALHTNGGAITSGSYEFKNQSDLPVRVSFKEMSVTNSDGLNFVSNATADGEIHLNLVPGTGANPNGFTGISNIAPGAYTSLLGTLDGGMAGSTGKRDGYLSIGGYYKGPFTITPKLPTLEFTFNFTLVQ